MKNNQLQHHQACRQHPVSGVLLLLLLLLLRVLPALLQRLLLRSRLGKPRPICSPVCRPCPWLQPPSWPSCCNFLSSPHVALASSLAQISLLPTILHSLHHSLCLAQGGPVHSDAATQSSAFQPLAPKCGDGEETVPTTRCGPC